MAFLRENNMYKDINKQREFQKLRNRAIRKEYFKDKQCEWCESTDKLVIHHVNPETKTSHKIWSWSEDKRHKELEKCIVLCDKCHREHHNPKQPLVHGTVNAYRYKKCRCEKCREWKHNEYVAYRNRKAVQVFA